MLIFHPFWWLSSFKHGWDEPVPGWVTRAGYDFGHLVVLPALIFVIFVTIIFFAVLVVKRL